MRSSSASYVSWRSTEGITMVNSLAAFVVIYFVWYIWYNNTIKIIVLEENIVDDLWELKQKITDLITSPKGIQNELLQDINAMLLTQYVIQVKDAVIEPLRVEAYLYVDGRFEDKFIHRPNQNALYGAYQRNRFGQLYIHPGYSGVDIVLSLDNTYAYSCLIKNSRISVGGNVAETFVKQYGAAKFLKEIGFRIDDRQVVLKKREHPRNDIVFNTVRKGLLSIKERPDFSKEEQNQFNTRPIASLIELKEHTSSEFKFETGYGGDWIVVQYLKKVKENNPDITASELNQLRKELYPNGSKSLLEKEFGKIQ